MNGVSNQNIVYITENPQFQNLNSQTQNYIREISTLNSYWKRLILARIGKDSNINIARMFIMLQSTNLNGLCENILFMYPAESGVSMGSSS